MDEDTTQNAVNTPDETTGTESAPVEQTTPESDQTGSDDLKTVPYDRFKEVNEGFQSTKTEIAALKQQLMELNASGRQQTAAEPVNPEVAQAKETLKSLMREMAPEMGFVSKDELRRQKEDEALSSDLSRLEKEWDGSKDPALKFKRQEVIDYAVKNGISNPELAFKAMKENEILNYRIKIATSKSGGIQTEGSNGTGSQQAGTSDDDLKTAALKGDRQAHLTYLKRLSKSK